MSETDNLASALSILIIRSELRTLYKSTNLYVLYESCKFIPRLLLCYCNFFSFTK